MAPKHSFIVPVYNVASFLNACLDSIQAQTERDWECLCIDDGSTDGSGAILDAYAQQEGRFKVIHQANAGVSAARNVGLSRAQGAWISFVDSDDTIVEDYLEVFFKTPEKADINFLGVKHCFEDGSSVTYCSTTHGLVTRSSRDYYKTICTHWLNPQKGNITGFVSLKIFRGDFLRESNLRFVDGLSHQEDLIFVLKAAETAKTLQVIPYAFYNYRVSMTGLTYQPYDKEKYFESFWEILKKSNDPYLTMLICQILFVELRIGKRMKRRQIGYATKILPYVKSSLKPSVLRVLSGLPSGLRFFFLRMGSFLHLSPKARFVHLDI